MSDVLSDRERLEQLRATHRMPQTAQLQVTMNIPGPNKRIPQASWLFHLCQERLLFFLEETGCCVQDVVCVELEMGPVLFLAVKEDPFLLKRHCLRWEGQEPLSPYWDLDVYDGVTKISRHELGAAPRRCFICDLSAKQCAFFQSHSVEELVSKLVLDVQAFLETSRRVEQM